MRTSGLSFGSPKRASDTELSEGRSPTHRQHRCTAPAVRPLRWGTLAEIQWQIAIDARSLDIGKPQTNNGRCGNQPANKSLINRRLKPHRRPCALARKQTLWPGRVVCCPASLTTDIRESLGYQLPGWDFDDAVGRHERGPSWIGHACWPTSLRRWTKNCWLGMNI